MRRGLIRLAAPALVVGAMTAGGLVGCGDDGGGGAGAPTTAGRSDEELVAEIDEFCTGVEEFQELVGQMAGDLEDIDPALQSQVADEARALARTELELEPQVSDLLPGDIARYERCAEELTPSG